MTQPSNPPSVRNLVLGILELLAASPAAQLNAIDAYNQSNKLAPAHTWNPFVEIAEGLLKLHTDAKRECFNAASLAAVEEVECILELIFNQPDGCKVNPEQIN